MRKYGVIAVVILLAWTFMLNAHPASDVRLQYDGETHLLKVEFDHQVKDPTNHFIYEIDIMLNKKAVIHQELLSQDDEKTGYLIYRIVDVNPGDVIKVTTNCNKTGKKSAELIIPAD